MLPSTTRQDSALLSVTLHWDIVNMWHVLSSFDFTEHKIQNSQKTEVQT